MKIEELKVGNYIKVNVGLGSEPLIVNLDILKEVQIANLRFEGIKISENWLILLGFECVGRKIELHYSKDIFHWYSSTEAITLELDNGLNSYDYHTDVIYIHQLQNLYYDLMFSELKINL